MNNTQMHLKETEITVSIGSAWLKTKIFGWLLSMSDLGFLRRWVLKIEWWNTLLLYFKQSKD